VLLSSIPGAAVTAVRTEPTYREFATIPGVKEDTNELLLNLKQLRLKSHSDQSVTLRLEAQGPGVVTAADLIYPSEIEIANPEVHLARLDSPDARLDMELTVERGVGYLPSDGRESVPLGWCRSTPCSPRFAASITPSRARGRVPARTWIG
jgi:DNA-directed RNA polymerase subunit alpha